MGASLEWKKTSERLICKTPVFSVFEMDEIPPEGSDVSPGKYDAIEAPDWAVIIPVMNDSFVMVRQWRHGEQRVTLEFPSGVCDAGETAIVTAERELLEETGCRAASFRELSVLSSNPALFKNHIHIFLAEGLTPTGKQDLDSDEVLTYECVPIAQVIASIGTGEFTHAYTATALFLYLRDKLSGKMSELLR